MKKAILFLVSGIMLASAGRTQTADPGCVDGNIYLKYREGMVKAKIADPENIKPSVLPGLQTLITKYSITHVEKPFHQAIDSKDLQRVYKVKFSNIMGVESLIKDLAADPAVEYAEKVPICVTSYTPNDPMYTSPNNWHLLQINAPSAWNVYNGTSTITVAVVDNAIMTSHPDLLANIWTNPGEIPANGIDDDGNGWIDDGKGWDVGDNDNNVLPPNTTFSHGSHCSGIAGARTDNTVGIASIGFNVKIMPVKATANSAGANTITNGYGGIIYAARSHARVISCSWGGTVSASTDQSVIDYAWNKGCIIICAAANDGNNVLHYPAAYNNVYAVASTGSGDAKSSFSCYGTWVDISAPGENIYSTIPNTSYGNMSGTSMATPLVAGLAGLMLSKNPYMSQTQVLNCISSSAVNINALNPSYVGQLGAGRIDAFAAMNCAAAAPGSPPVADFFANKQVTCPLNNINFYDASILYPTSWSWTFQGGTPATSTSSAPVVSWATAGTYSVSLTATNLYGSNSVTKTAYITITNPGSLPIVEGFQGAAWPPANWVDDNKFSDSVKWTRSTAVGGYGLSTASALFDNYNNDASGIRDGLMAPKVNMSNVIKAHLRFDVAFARYDGTYSDSMEVALSTDCGNTWNTIYYKGGTTLATSPDYSAAVFVPTSTQWRTDSIDISTLAAGQGNVLIDFINHGHYGQALYIDNVNIAYTLAPVPTANFNNATNVCSGVTTTFTDVSTNSPTSWSWSLPGSSAPTSTVQNPTVSYASAGVYSITLVASNGSGPSTPYTTTISILASPSLSTSGTASICAGGTATLTASGATSYSWSTSASTASIAVSPASTAVYTVTGTSGSCSSSKTSTVTVAPGPGVSVASSNPSCFGSCNGTSTITVTGGTGPYTYSTTPPTCTTPICSAFCAGSYTYYVTDALGCKGNTTLTMSQPPAISSSVNSTSASCFGMCNGSTSITATGGTAPYTYTLSPTMCTALTCSALCAGNYTYQVMDAKGCNATYSFTITQPVTLGVSVSSTSASCGTCPNGAVSSTVTGGTGPYSYTWTPGGAPTPTVGNLLPGCYTVTISDAMNCTQSSSVCVGFATGISVMNALSGNIYIVPNPNNGRFTINSDLTEAFDVSIYNSIGQLIVNLPQNRGDVAVDLAPYAKGIYNVLLSVNGAYKNVKVVVE